MPVVVVRLATRAVGSEVRGEGGGGSSAVGRRSVVGDRVHGGSRSWVARELSRAYKS